MSNISEWSTIEVNNTHLDELTLSGEGALYTNKIMCAVKEKFDEVDGKLDKVQGAFVYKGTKATYADLEAVQNPSVGDVYNVTELSGENFAWNGTSWDSQGAQGVVLTRDAGDDGAAFHNCIYRGKDLTNVYTLAQLSTKLSNGDFSDLYIGDYITLPVVIDGTSQNFNFRIAHFNYWKYMGDTSFTQNHIVFVPDTAFKNMQMQTTNTTEGGVPATLVWSALQGDLYTAVNAATCMNGHVKTHRDWIPDSVNTSAMSAAGANFQGSTVNTSTMWRDVKLGLMKEPMVYGTTAFSSSGYDVGCGKSQLALFKIDPTWINGRASSYNWWLGCVVSSSVFAGAYGGGGAHGGSASGSLGVRPYLLFA